DGAKEAEAVQEWRDPRYVGRLAAVAPEGRIALAIELVVDGEEPAQVIPVRADAVVREGTICRAVDRCLETPEQIGDLDDHHVERRRLQRLDEAVRVADGDGVALPELPVPAAPEAERPRLAELR